VTIHYAAPASAEAFRLGDGPVWDAARRRVLWVDVDGGAVLIGELDGGWVRLTTRLEFGCPVGAVAVGTDGRLLVAAQDRLVTVDPDGVRRDGPRIVPAGQRRRLNHGKPDPAGRFLIGTVPLAGESDRECLVRAEPGPDPDRDWALTTIDDDLELSTGLAWSVDGRRMFSVDSRARTVWVRDYDPDTGAVGRRRVHLRIDDGVPGGICTDAADHLWLAVWGGGQVRRFAPDGALVERVAVPGPHTTCVAFAADALDVLVITTATSGLTGEQLHHHPGSGRLFSHRPQVPGLPVPPWGGADWALPARPSGRPASVTLEPWRPSCT
jgi:sugar lactone lactonase YvrE